MAEAYSMSRYDEETGQYKRRQSLPASSLLRQSTIRATTPPDVAISSRATKPTPRLEEDVPEFQRILNGFPRTARYLSADEGKSTVLVRRFDEAAVRNLLHLEGRVAALEAAQRRFDRDDFERRKDNEPVTRAASSWEQFALLSEISASHGDPNGAYTRVPRCVMEAWAISREDEVQSEINRYQEYNSEYGTRRLQELRALGRFGYDQKDLHIVQERWELSRVLEKALKEYQKAVLRYRDMLKMEEPAARTDIAVQKWIQGDISTRDGRKLGRQFLKGSAMDEVFDPERVLPRTLWQRIFNISPANEFDPKHKDRITLGVSASVDPLTKGVMKWRWLMKKGRMKGFRYREIVLTPEHYINKIVTGAVLAYAALSLVGALWFLYLVRTKQRHIEAVLGLLSFFIILFGLSLLLFTNSSRTEVFAATAAYAAVLVVFLGQGGGQDGA